MMRINGFELVVIVVIWIHQVIRYVLSKRAVYQDCKNIPELQAVVCYRIFDLDGNHPIHHMTLCAELIKKTIYKIGWNDVVMSSSISQKKYCIQSQSRFIHNIGW